ncbi:hypothetical protein BC629DRAFT_1593395 [Irpex lacteus]|nr:hypothetical protein BC629DRAFT_1593395 [Irpex lacteus]
MKSDGNDTPDGICTNCVAFKFKCTYVQSAPKRPLDPGYVESLEEQVSSMRSLLDKYRQLYPGMEASGRISRTTALGSSSIPARSSSPHSPQESAPIESPYSLASTSSAHQTFPIASVPSPILTDNEPEFDPSDDELQNA